MISSVAKYKSIIFISKGKKKNPLMELKEAIWGIRKAMDLKLGSWGLKNRTVTCRLRDSHSERGVVQCQKHGILKARQPGFEHRHCHQSHLTLWCLGFLIFHIGGRAA